MSKFLRILLEWSIFVYGSPLLSPVAFGFQVTHGSRTRWIERERNPPGIGTLSSATKLFEKPIPTMIEEEATTTSTNTDKDKDKNDNDKNDNDNVDSSSSATIRFVTPPMQVFIEDTDAYGIMYNSNYLRCYDRALHLSMSLHKNSNNNINNSTATNGNSPGPATLLSGTHEGWSIVAVGQQKFVASPTLGQEFYIEATRKSGADDWEVWDMALKSLDDEKESVLYNRVQDLQIAKPNYDAKNDGNDDGTRKRTGSSDSSSNLYSVTHAPPYDLEAIQPQLVATDTFTVYRDEIDAHWQGHLPLRNVLNLFERSRTNTVGGPDGLKRLQHPQEGDGGNGVLVVVTGISNLTSIDEGALLQPGQSVQVDTAVVVKRRGMVLDYYQTLRQSNNGDSSSGARFAQGKVTLMMLDAKTRRPTAKLPAWVRAMLEEAGGTVVEERV